MKRVGPAEVESALAERWPESILDPSLDRIRDLLDFTQVRLVAPIIRSAIVPTAIAMKSAELVNAISIPPSLPREAILLISNW